MSKVPSLRDGSTVHLGGYECETQHCMNRRTPAALSLWKSARGESITTWIVCHECAVSHRRGCALALDLRLPLLHPSDPYARIAVEEMSYAIAAFGEQIRETPHSERGCYFDEERPVCWCGKRSWLDVADWRASCQLVEPASLIRDRYRRHRLAKFVREQAEREWRTQPFNPPRVRR